MLKTPIQKFRAFEGNNNTTALEFTTAFSGHGATPLS